MDRRLLWCSPLPPVRSGVSDFAVDLLSELGRLCGVRVVTPPDVSPSQDVIDTLPVCVVPFGTQPDDGERVVAHLGNNPHHRWILPYLSCDGVVAVVHDLVLHHLLIEDHADDGLAGDLEARLQIAHGRAGLALARARAVGYRGALDPFLFPARKAFLGRTQALLAHSEWGCRELRKEFPDTPVHRVPLTVTDPFPMDRRALRSDLGIDDDHIVVMHMGFLTPEKGLAPLLEAVAVLRRRGVPMRLVVVGEGTARNELEGAAEVLGITDALQWTGWVDDAAVSRLPAAADIGVVLRNPSAGETSAAVLRFLAAGTPVAVTARNQFLEWPHEAAHRITPGAAAAADLIAVFEGLVDCDREPRRRAARSAYEAGHRPVDAARHWLGVLERDFSAAAGP